jgi:hypothetical protein
MLEFRKKERILKQTTGNTTCTLQEQVLDKSTPAAWASAVQKVFLKEIVKADPFDAFAVKIQPYVLDLLKSCKSWHPLSSSVELQRFVFILAILIQARSAFYNVCILNTTDLL